MPTIFIPPEGRSKRQTLAAPRHGWFCTLDMDQQIHNLPIAFAAICFQLNRLVGKCNPSNGEFQDDRYQRN
jgi:hypothetical protein